MNKYQRLSPSCFTDKFHIICSEIIREAVLLKEVDGLEFEL